MCALRHLLVVASFDGCPGFVAPGESPGTLNIQGDLTQAADGKLVIEIGGNTPGLFDVLNVSDKLTSGGTLEVTLLNGFTPGANDTFNFLTFGSLRRRVRALKQIARASAHH